MRRQSDSLIPSLDVDRQPPMELFRRHVGLPASVDFDDRLEELFAKTHAWYAEHGEPWVDAREFGIHRVVYDVIHFECQQQLSDSILARGLDRVGAHVMIVVAASAGSAVNERIDELSKSDRPDEAMFLNAYALATVEHVRSQAGLHLRTLFGKEGLTVLPHYSPGYEGWGIADSARLYRLLRHDGTSTYSPLKLLPSGFLSPRHSILAAFGVTQRSELGEELDLYWDCRGTPAVLKHSPANYAFPEKALMRWRDERLTITAGRNKHLSAVFRWDGSTCTNLGMPLAFDYEVAITHENDAGYRIVSSACKPIEKHTGYQSMCAYHDDSQRFMDQLRQYCPLEGKLLHESLSWDPPTSPAGCLCTRASQDHKWRIVLQTIHFALNNS